MMTWYRHSWIALVVILSASVVTAQDDPRPGAPGIGDPYFEMLGNGGYDVDHYTLTLDIDMIDLTLDSVAQIDATAAQALSAFNLDFSALLNLGIVTVNDAPAETARDGDELTITPSQPIAAGAAFTVRVEYDGTPNADQMALRTEENPSAGIDYSSGWHFIDGQVMTASEPYGASSWYPVNDHPLDKATYTFDIRVTPGAVAVANGVLTTVETVDGADRYVWEMRQPMASYLAAVQVGDFVLQEGESPAGVPIRNFFPTDRFSDGVLTFARQGEMIDFFSGLFGAYPFDAYGVVVVDLPLFFALETQSISLFGVATINRGRFGGANEIIAHELAHQWFGNSVTLGEWADIWLNEGFASYMSWLWAEHDLGADTLDRIVRSNYDWVSGNWLVESDTTDAELADIRAELAVMIVPPGAPPQADLFNGGGVYIRGGLALHALRLEVGDDIFFELLRTYYERFAFDSARIEDFIAVANEVAGRSLDAFFAAWLTDPLIPPIPQMELERLIDG
ncbi:MAG: M1 family metallopeptidase [Chloroflexota bacterium]|nr:M1 family metallopeptidase [Chloroflexota bacterium]